jgi:hypothetical protein
MSSYGVLIVDGSYGTPLTETLGWAYNFENGIGFGVAYGFSRWRAGGGTQSHLRSCWKRPR